MVSCSESDPWGNINTFNCTHGCCGSASFVYCCSSLGLSYVPKTWTPDLPGHTIAAITAGCVLALVVIVGVVYVLCRQAKRKDKFLEQTIARLRVPPSKAIRHVNATPRMYPGPRRDVTSVPTYTPRDRPRLTSTPIPLEELPEPKPSFRPPRKIGLKSFSNKAKHDPGPREATPGPKGNSFDVKTDGKGIKLESPKKGRKGKKSDSNPQRSNKRIPTKKKTT